MLCAALLISANPALAYIGPGAGLGAIVITGALIVGVVLLVVGFLWYPLKRMLKGKKQADQGAGAEK
ncbi:hypothetical protein FPS10_21225 [Pseudoruegeria sp. M32A2M]|nr:hypothetical protein [Pseudoruegeria sp. M32A2M]